MNWKVAVRSDITHREAEPGESEFWKPYVCPPRNGVFYSGRHPLEIWEHSLGGEFSD